MIRNIANSPSIFTSVLSASRSRLQHSNCKIALATVQRSGFCSDKNTDPNKSEADGIQKVWDVPRLEKIYTNNRKWVAEKKKNDPGMFERLAKAQKPEFFVIGCSDARVPAQEIMGLNTGELFVHRNVANLCINTDLNFLSVVDFAINTLEIKDILVLGHYGCGGIQASTQQTDPGIVSHWLRHIRDIQRLHHAELAAIPDEKARLKRLVEINVREQCLNLFRNPIVQKSWTENRYPYIHGFVYDIQEGLLKKLRNDALKIEERKFRGIYAMYPKPSTSPSISPRGERD